jgi:hypothetical protein
MVPQRSDIAILNTEQSEVALCPFIVKLGCQVQTAGKGVQAGLMIHFGRYRQEIMRIAVRHTVRYTRRDHGAEGHERTKEWAIVPVLARPDLGK